MRVAILLVSGLFVLCCRVLKNAARVTGGVNGLGLLALGAGAAELGREVSLPVRLADGEEVTRPVTELLRHGEQVFRANWTVQEGGGRPRTKGNGQPLTAGTAPLVFPRNFNRVSAPDANSCAGCHNAPVPGGNGDIVANVFVTAQRFDFATFDPGDDVPTRGSQDERGALATLQTIGNSRATPGLFGAGYLEMLARQMTAELQAIRDALAPGQSAPLVSKGVNFGTLSRRADGTWDVSQVEGLPAPSVVSTGTVPPSLIIRPWHQGAQVVSLREFANNAFNHHHGIQSTERFGTGADPDGDGFADELSRAEVTAVCLFQAALPVPGRVIPSDPVIEAAVLNGENRFMAIGCAVCHVPNLPLTEAGWIYTEPNPYNPPGNLQPGQAPEVKLDLTDPALPGPRLGPVHGVVYVPAFTDFKLHDICAHEDDPNIEPLDPNAPAGSEAFFGRNRKFLTRRLWGVASKPNFFHHGLYTTLREAILAHDGEARAARDAFAALSDYDRNCVIEFLKTLRVLPPGATSLFVDEEGRPKPWPPARFTAWTRLPAGALRLSWAGDNGLYAPPRLFRLQQTERLDPPAWVDIETGPGATVEIPTSEGTGFFRLLPVHP